MAKRTSRDFSRKQIWELANSYANTDYPYSHEYYERKYQISEGTFYNLLEKAVIEHIVDMNVVKLMAEKAAYNSSTKSGKAGAERSKKHYNYLKKRRALYRLDKKNAIKLTIKYAESKLYKKEFANQNFITTQLLDTTFREAIVQCWVTDEVMKKLKEKSLRQNNAQSVVNFWEELESLRRDKKNQG